MTGENQTILLVDDEPNILEAMQRQFRKRFELDTAIGPEQGLQNLAERGPYAVIVSDLRMPGMNGIQFLTRAKEISPDSVRIMLTGHGDAAAAINAVNQGAIFRFLNKPCLPEVLGKTIEAALEQYRLVISERQLLEQTLQGAIGVLTEILGLSSPALFSHTARLREYMEHMTARFGCPNAWRFHVAAMLSQIGCITVPPPILAKVAASQPLTAPEQEIFDRHPGIGRDLIARIPRLEEVGQMVARQHEACHNPDEVVGNDDVVLGARMLMGSIDLDRLKMAGSKPDDALNTMRARGIYNLRVLDALSTFGLERESQKLRHLKADQLEPGMVVDQDVIAVNGLLLLARGQMINDSVIARLLSFRLTQGIVEPFRLLV